MMILESIGALLPLFLISGSTSVLAFQSTPYTFHSLRNTPVCQRLSDITQISSQPEGFDSKSIDQQQVEFNLHPSMSSISATSWDSFRAPDGLSPFLEHAFLLSLEDSNCVSPETGWIPQHVSMKIDGSIRAYVPMYVKSHSMGEFIFDNGWAEAAYQNGIQYYPKLLVGVPFTPVSGGRIIFHPEILENYSSQCIAELRALIVRFLKQIALSNKISSVHLNFITHDEATDISEPLSEPSPDSEEKLNGRVQTMLDQLTQDKNDYLRRTSMQYHWKNINAKSGQPYQSFEDYLSSFKSKRRISIRRERRSVMEEKGIRIDVVVGEDILLYDGLVERMFDVYLSTVNMFSGRQYLSRRFFQMLAKSTFIKNMCFMCVRQVDSGEKLKAEDVFAGTINIVKDGVFYGRYWGCLPGKEVKNLHFETCYWAAIEHCIDRGLHKMEPGAGGGDYKWVRGFDPALIHSAHYICHSGLRRAVHQFLSFETKNNVELFQYLFSRSSVGSNNLNKSANVD